MIEEINQVQDKNKFISFLNMFAKDFETNYGEWKNKSIPDFLRQMASWIEDYSECPINDIEWEKVDFKVMARILYIGKIYE